VFPSLKSGRCDADRNQTPGWLSIITDDPSWAKATNTTGVRILNKFAESLGQTAPDAVSLLSNHDILSTSPNKDYVSSLYNMALHANSVRPSNPRSRTSN